MAEQEGSMTDKQMYNSIKCNGSCSSQRK